MRGRQGGARRRIKSIICKRMVFALESIQVDRAVPGYIGEQERTIGDELEIVDRRRGACWDETLSKVVSAVENSAAMTEMRWSGARAISDAPRASAQFASSRSPTRSARTRKMRQRRRPRPERPPCSLPQQAAPLAVSSVRHPGGACWCSTSVHEQ